MAAPASETIVLVDVRGVEPDTVIVDALARLQLAVRRHGCRLRLRHASSELCDLVDFMGLADALPLADDFSPAGRSNGVQPPNRR